MVLDHNIAAMDDDSAIHQSTLYTLQPIQLRRKVKLADLYAWCIRLSVGKITYLFLNNNIIIKITLYPYVLFSSY